MIELTGRFMFGRPQIAMALAAGTVMAIAVLGTLLPPENHPGLLYLFPIFTMTWVFGAIAGLCTLLASGLLWLGAVWLSTAGEIPLPAAGQLVLHMIVYAVTIRSVARIRNEQEHRRTHHCAQRQGSSETRDAAIIPICSHCRKIRESDGRWQSFETYLQEHAAMQFTHGICAGCAEKVYREYQERKEDRRRMEQQKGEQP